MSDKIYLRRGNIANLPTLAQGEPGFALDTKKLYIGTASGNQGIVSSAPTNASWLSPTLLNGWVNFGGGFASAAYYKDDLGIVRLRGFLKSGTTGTIFILPAGYRPTEGLHVPTVSSNGGTITSGTITIGTGGDVAVEYGVSNNLILNHITFRAE